MALFRDLQQRWWRWRGEQPLIVTFWPQRYRRATVVRFDGDRYRITRYVRVAGPRRFAVWGKLIPGAVPRRAVHPQRTTRVYERRLAG